MTNRVVTTIDQASLAVLPGSPPVNVTVNLFNESDVIDQLTLTVEGIPVDWWSLDQPVVRLYPHEGSAVSFSIHPPARQDVMAGDYTVSVRVTSSSDEASTATASLTLSVLFYGGFDVQLRSLDNAGRRGMYSLDIRNLANSGMSLEVRAYDRDGELKFDLPSTVELAALVEVELPFSVRHRAGRLVGQPESHPITVELTPLLPDLAEADRQRRIVNAEFSYRPWLRQWPWEPLPNWARFALLTLLPLALLAYALLMLDGADVIEDDAQATIIGPDGKALQRPVIRDFNVEQTGDLYTLKWNIDGADRVILNGSDVPSQGEEISLPSPESSRYELFATNAAGESKAVAVVAIENGPIIRKFYGPTRITAGEPVQLEWAVSDAERIALYDESGLIAELGPDGRQELRPLDSTTYLLVASGPRGYSSAGLSVVVEGESLDPPEIRSLILCSDTGSGVQPCARGRPNIFTLGQELLLRYEVANAVGVTVIYGDSRETGYISHNGASRELRLQPLLRAPSNDYVVAVIAVNGAGERVVEFGKARAVEPMFIQDFFVDPYKCGAIVGWNVTGDPQGTVEVFRNGVRISDRRNEPNFFDDLLAVPTQGGYQVEYRLVATNTAGLSEAREITERLCEP